MIADNVPAATLEKERRAASEVKFVRILALIASGLVLFVTLVNWGKAEPGSSYLGMQYNVDDHMVYAAWMRQAMDGRLLFDNRFTIDPQPGLTINLYFLLLGWLAKIVGIPLAMATARVGFTAAFVFLLYRLVRRICPDVYTTKLAMSLAVFGGGMGFLVWQTFGNAIDKPISPILSRLMLGRLPTDVWQPEGYVFPSALTNGLFMVSLCLIVVVLLSFLTAKEDWRSVPHGMVAMFLLMNIHSYDVLLIAFVMAGLLVMSIVRRQLTGSWLARSLVIASGAVPPALWFLYVLERDPVFQARAATPTYTANFRQVVFGYFLLLIFGLIALVARADGDQQPRNVRHILGFGLIAALTIGLFVLARSHVGDAYFLPMVGWGAAMLALLAGLALVAGESPGWNLAASWATIGLLAPYFPALFQRKLSMGLAIPWAVLAALAVGTLTRRLDRSTRNLVLVLSIVIVSATSLRWMTREFLLASQNVSNTTTHPVFLSTDAAEIMRRLNSLSGGRKVVLSMPGVSLPEPNVPDFFRSPYMPDLNPIVSGLTGSYTYAGHWSETPDYLARRAEETRFFLSGTSEQERRAFIQKTGAAYIIAPVPQAFPALQLEDLSGLGDVAYDGQQFRLVKLR